jgi:hypothetical protein
MRESSFYYAMIIKNTATRESLRVTKYKDCPFLNFCFQA